MPYLRITVDKKTTIFEIPENKMVVFGRETHTDFQILNDSLISREHFAIEKDENGKWLLIDLGARNGTFLNGRKLDNETVELNDKDEIKAGKQTFTYFLKHPPKPKSAQEIFTQVENAIGKGKGFSTIMSEIIGKPKKK